MKINEKVRNALFIGTLCSVSYLAVYLARNILSAVTPQMITSDGYTEAYIGEISSLYFIFYAVGQLINGAIGDKIKARYMISGGLLFAAITNFVFSQITQFPSSAAFVYGLTGFFLAMIYGPMTKVVAENTEPIYATRCSLGYTFASFFGSPLAGMLASFMAWQTVFAVSSSILIIMSACVFGFFLYFERQGIVKYGQYDRIKTGGKKISADGIRLLIKHRIIKFSFISIVTGVIRTAVVFWMPTYISQYLGYSPDTSARLFTIATLAISMTAFIAIFVYERLKRNMDATMLLMFILATVFFIGMYFIKQPIVNLLMFVLAIMASNAGATMLWSRYCPSLRDTGMVSSATGFLDFLSYMAAAAATRLFANAVPTIGWGNVILTWIALEFCAVFIVLPYGKMFGARAKKSE